MRQEHLLGVLQRLLPEDWRLVWQLVEAHRRDHVRWAIGRALISIAECEEPDERFKSAAVILMGHEDRKDELVLDGAMRTITWQERTIRLTRTEYRLVARLCAGLGTAVSTAELMEDVWGFKEVGRAPDTELIRSHVRNIRYKLARQGIGDRLFVSKRGEGYWLTISPEQIRWS